MTHHFKTRKEIAEELCISTSTLSRHLKKANIKIPRGQLLKPAEYDKIYKMIKGE